MTIQAIFFDMGGTIEPFWYSRELRLAATPGIQRRLLAGGIDLKLDNEQLYELVSRGLNRYHQWALQALEELPTREIWRRYILADFPVDLGRLEEISEDLSYYVETHYYHREMRPEIPVVLEQIHSLGIKIGLISNVSSHSQVPKNLEKYGIKQYFYPIVLSSVYGRRKPDPAIFHHAARLAKVPVSTCAYVGDRVTRDIEGARRAGFQLAIQIRHDFNPDGIDEGAKPDAIIGNMQELVDILASAVEQPNGIPGTKQSTRQKLRAFLFDAGDILYHRPHAWRKFRKYLRDLGLPETDQHLPENDTFRIQAYRGQISQEEYHRRFIQLCGVTSPGDIQIGLDILEEEQNEVTFFEGVQVTLHTLKRNGYLLGIITDTTQPLYNKLNWFERVGIGDVWDAIICSNELGISKPDSRIYRATLEQLGILPEEAVFVGHKKTELDGAKAVGIRTIAFNQEHDAIADNYIKKFSDLLQFTLLSSEAETMR